MVSSAAQSISAGKNSVARIAPTAGVVRISKHRHDGCHQVGGIGDAGCRGITPAAHDGGGARCGPGAGLLIVGQRNHLRVGVAQCECAVDSRNRAMSLSKVHAVDSWGGLMDLLHAQSSAAGLAQCRDARDDARRLPNVFSDQAMRRGEYPALADNGSTAELRVIVIHGTGVDQGDLPRRLADVGGLAVDDPLGGWWCGAAAVRNIVE